MCENSTKEELSFSSRGYQFLTSYEIGTDFTNLDYVRLDANGNITEIKNQDLSDGGYTIGIGVFVDKSGSDKERIEILEKHGIQWNDTNQWVSIEVAKEVFSEISPSYENNVKKLIKKHNLQVSQNQFDALFLFGYNRPALIDGGAVDKLVASKENDIKRWREDILDEYKKIPTWNDFGNGWTNRVEDILELYFEEDYTRNH